MQDKIIAAIADYLQAETEVVDTTPDRVLLNFGSQNPGHFTKAGFCQEIAAEIYAAIQPHLQPNFSNMQMLELKKITPVLYEVRVKDSWHRVGTIEMQEDGFYQFFPGTGTAGNGYFSSYTLREVANILDAMNSPLVAHLKAYFDSLPAEVSREEESEDTPF